MTEELPETVPFEPPWCELCGPPCLREHTKVLCTHCMKELEKGK